MNTVLRAKTDTLIKTRELSEMRLDNTRKNSIEMKAKKRILQSMPQRLVFEMTNACNLNCIMCGRNARHFKATHFNMDWLKKFDEVVASVEEVTLMGWGEPTMHPHFVEFLVWANVRGLRKYFCTNGMKLGELLPHIFEQQVDVIAISIDAADSEGNKAIRRGADFDAIIRNIKNIVAEKKRRNTPWPYMNFVTTLMKKNLHDFSGIVELAAEIGLDEAKAVFLTVFDEALEPESLYDSMDDVKAVFEEAGTIALATGVKIKLPHLRGSDPSRDACHKPCYTPWRDFFLGSDGFVRPCMSTPIKLFHIDKYKTFDEMWNSPEFMRFREQVNEEAGMSVSCRHCYQSSFANWNKKSSFYQIGEEFSPEWEIQVSPSPPPPSGLLSSVI
jgi:MoaA/NifB/PqqE/SkfB family radical SAM enzyme